MCIIVCTRKKVVPFLDGVLCKQCKSDQGLLSFHTDISIENAVKMKNPPETPKTRNGLIQNDKDGQVHWSKKGLFLLLHFEIKTRGQTEEGERKEK